jgi:hypothetical protein
MKRLIALSALLSALVMLATPALAFQCPKLVKQITDTTSNRYDAVASQAKLDAAEAAKLHAEGKHAEAEKIAKETIAKLAAQ